MAIVLRFLTWVEVKYLCKKTTWVKVKSTDPSIQVKLKCTGSEMYSKDYVLKQKVLKLKSFLNQS